MSNSRSNKHDFSELRKKAEEKLRQSPAKTAAGEIEHELNVHEIELRMQNMELLETQEKLNAALLEYSELFELSPVGYFILDKNGIIEKVNERGTVQLGLEKAGLLGKPFSSFLYTEIDQDNFYRHKNLAIEEGTLQRLECEIKKKDGSVFSAFVKSKVIKGEKLEFKHLLSIVTDISGIKEHEHLVEMQLIKSEELNAMKSRFISMASHEFRTPLSAVLSSTSLIEQYLQNGEADKTKRHLTRIKSSIRTLVSILDEFLSIEKLESGKVEIQRSIFDLTEFCNDLIEEVHAIRKKGQVIHYHHAGDNEVNEDRNIIQHILINLLSNACKYSGEEKEINLFTNISDHNILLIVKDHGIGIPEAEQQNVFSRFFRAHNTGNMEGTGLGLTVVKRYVELLNGTINFTSRQNEGTTFTVELPRSQMPF
ncbi:PAS domain-containing sensor histidine kinase [Mucilaginibacter gotjawali]|uniref:histidine kinase n=2 Tax=Mucilaginibacter gotjawali TaxID=1550579 RepID=A0A0X8X1F6_9SPHI|nr:PAS domain-containing sensor histidine kinase [Mucilaginibacter gotjawali]MBB3053774.1 PAS domain S-box-containing protein [Mucilaginibacter gotjawali]BAU54036.1 Histidine protein kinase DivJ [Mucilaginibacter gotjawali]